MIIRLILTPLSWIYGLVTGIRNLLYDKSILKSYSFDIPVIVVGNLIAGGTGKSPFVAWLAGELSAKYQVAVLSRGFGRKSKGFHLLDNASTPEMAGDEPMEMRLLLPDVTIAVDRNRKRGIEILKSGKYGKIDIILMDDGFRSGLQCSRLGVCKQLLWCLMTRLTLLPTRTQPRRWRGNCWSMFRPWWSW